MTTDVQRHIHGTSIDMFRWPGQGFQIDGMPACPMLQMESATMDRISVRTAHYLALAAEHLDLENSCCGQGLCAQLIPQQ